LNREEKTAAEQRYKNHHGDTEKKHIRRSFDMLMMPFDKLTVMSNVESVSRAEPFRR
jgi:hypothetical protein